MRKPGDWMASEAWLSFAGHTAWGLIVVLVSGVFDGQCAALVAWAVLVPVIGFKEAVVDPRYETGEDLKSGAVDFGEWMLGAAVGNGIVWLAEHVGRIG